MRLRTTSRILLIIQILINRENAFIAEQGRYVRQSSHDNQ